MRRYDDDDDDHPRPRLARSRHRRAGNGLPKPGPIAIALGVAGLLILMSFLIPGAGLALMWVGIAIAVVANLWFLLVVLSDSILQVLLCFFIPFYSLFYILTHWEESRHPFLLSIYGTFILSAV